MQQQLKKYFESVGSETAPETGRIASESSQDMNITYPDTVVDSILGTASLTEQACQHKHNTKFYLKKQSVQPQIDDKLTPTNANLPFGDEISISNHRIL